MKQRDFVVVEMKEETGEVKTFQNGAEVQMKAGTCTPELCKVSEA